MTVLFSPNEMVDRVQPRETDDDKVDGDDVVQQPRSNKDQDARKESNDRRDMGCSEMHGDLRIRCSGWKDLVRPAFTLIR